MKRFAALMLALILLLGVLTSALPLIGREDGIIFDTESPGFTLTSLSPSESRTPS